MTTASSAELRALRHALATASDSRIAQIAGLADALEDQQQAQDLLAPIRARLRPLRPERKLRLPRMLATPLETVLIDAGKWHDGAVTVPRSAIRPLCDVIIDRAPSAVAEVEAMIADATTRADALVARAGEHFWPQAGEALRTATAPLPSWRQAGLPEKSFRAMADAVCGCLVLAPRMEKLADPAMPGFVLDQIVMGALRQAALVGPIAWGMLLALLVCRLPHAQAPRGMLMQQNAATVRRDAAEAALDHVWTWIEDAAEGSALDLSEAARGLQARAALLHAFAGEKAWRSRAGTLQATLRQAYGRHVAEAAEERLIAPLAALPMAPDDAAMTRLEDEARGLRRLAGAIRVLGAMPQADAALRHAAQAAAVAPALAKVDKARLVEILDDADTAMGVLGR